MNRNPQLDSYSRNLIQEAAHYADGRLHASLASGMRLAKLERITNKYLADINNDTLPQTTKENTVHTLTELDAIAQDAGLNTLSGRIQTALENTIKNTPDAQPTKTGWLAKIGLGLSAAAALIGLTVPAVFAKQETHDAHPYIGKNIGPTYIAIEPAAKYEPATTDESDLPPCGYANRTQNSQTLDKHTVQIPKNTQKTAPKPVSVPVLDRNYTQPTAHYTQPIQPMIAVQKTHEKQEQDVKQNDNKPGDNKQNANAAPARIEKTASYTEKAKASPNSTQSARQPAEADSNKTKNLNEQYTLIDKSDYRTASKHSDTKEQLRWAAQNGISIEALTAYHAANGNLKQAYILINLVEDETAQERIKAYVRQRAQQKILRRNPTTAVATGLEAYLTLADAPAPIQTTANTKPNHGTQSANNNTKTNAQPPKYRYGHLEDIVPGMTTAFNNEVWSWVYERKTWSATPRQNFTLRDEESREEMQDAVVGIWEEIGQSRYKWAEHVQDYIDDEQWNDDDRKFLAYWAMRSMIDKGANKHHIEAYLTDFVRKWPWNMLESAHWEDRGLFALLQDIAKIIGFKTIEEALFGGSVLGKGAGATKGSGAGGAKILGGETVSPGIGG